MEKSDDRRKDLMKALADTISQVFSRSEEIKQALSMMEKEGYHVDLILASVTRVSKREESRASEMEISNFDRSFLKKIRIRFEEGDRES